MPSLGATTSTPARKPFVRTHYVHTNVLRSFPISLACLGLVLILHITEVAIEPVHWSLPRLPTVLVPSVGEDVRQALLYRSLQKVIN